ncbi:MAG: 2,3-bisphosphoglycerate-independent phosphoglycerate mutase [Xanthomonadales bacterium]|nr:2,3-bisphosphoglycerate-independent phosphoglycerate mutase [Xanthomonadales bacterium]
MSENGAHRPLVLVIIDGWGHREDAPDNAISQADTPCWDRLWRTAATSLLETSGSAVGLPDGQMGNSEVGHMNIGAGRVVYQDFTRITKAIEDGSFFENEAFCGAVDRALDHDGAVHIMGLLSPGGVHSHDDHFLATVELARRRGARRIVVHAFLDGRDTPPRSALASIERMQATLDGVPGARFGTLAGRYYAMDRDQRWERVERAWAALTRGAAEHRSPSAAEALETAYARDENDEFIAPSVIGDYPGMADGDSVLFINFRADRARQLSRAFVEPGFDGFPAERPRLAAFATMTEYLKGLDARVAFPNEALPGLLGEILAAQGLRQLRIAETEKYAHVTFFLNGGREEPFEHEQRILIPSPKVATYDLQPEMSAPELTDALDGAIRSGDFDVIICNIANPDMVGHSGSLAAAMQAVAAVDACLARISAALEAVGGELIITSDHGNVEQMQDERSGQVHTAHTTNPVPFVFVGRPATAVPGGSLRDIAPTMLGLLGIQPPEVMTGQSLLRLDGGNADPA